MLFWLEMVQSRRRFPLTRKTNPSSSSPKAICKLTTPRPLPWSFLQWVRVTTASPVIHGLPESLPLSEEGLVSEPGLWLWALGWRKPPGLASTPAPPKAVCSTTRWAFPPGMLSKLLPANTSRPASTGIPNRDKSGAPGGSWMELISRRDISLLIKSGSPGSTWNRPRRDQVLRAGADWLQKKSPSL